MVAILLHFLFLSTFGWLLVEAIHLYRMLTHLRDVNHGQMHCYFFIGFGGPALIVGLSVGVSVDQYGNHFFCWLSVHESVVWSLVGPVCVIVVITLGVFIMALKSSMQIKDTVTDFGNLKTLLWLAVMLLPIQGSTWVLAMLSVNETHAVLHYAFSLFSLLEGVYIFVGYCVINKRVQQQVYFMWLHVGKRAPYHEALNGVKVTSHSTAAYHTSSKVLQRSIGISTSSATSRSTAKTSASPYRSGSQMKASTGHHASMSDVTESPGEQSQSNHSSVKPDTSLITRECQKNANFPISPCMADIINGNHPSIESSHSSDENNMGKHSETSRMAGCSESSSPGPRMGINIFSYPRLPGLWNSQLPSPLSSAITGSRSPLNKSGLSLKMGMNSKEQSADWSRDGTSESQRSTPLSAPVSNVRPEFPAPRMGISGVEKSFHSSRDRLTDSGSQGSTPLSAPLGFRPEFRMGISYTSRSATSSRERLSDNCSSGSHCHELMSVGKNGMPGKTGLYERRRFAYSSRDKLVANSLRHSPQENNQSEERHLKSPKQQKLSEEQVKSSFSSLGSCAGNKPELLLNKVNKPLSNCTLDAPPLCGDQPFRSPGAPKSFCNDRTVAQGQSKESLKEGSTHSESSPVHTQSTPGTGSYLDRLSPPLIDDTPSEDDLPIHPGHVNQKSSSTPASSACSSYKSGALAHLVSGHAMIIPPLATAELTDTDCRRTTETAV